MVNQSMMVPPNNAPWPGLQAPTHSQPPTTPPASYSHSHAHHAHSSSYPPPPPSPYYHHPPPPPHHPHHGPPPPHHGPPPPHHYPYHPYAAAPYPPPYPPHSSSHPAYHHPPPHPSGHHPPPPPASIDPSSSSTKAPASSPGAESLSGSISSTKAIKSKPVPNKTKNGKASSESSDTPSTSASSAPKTFRFEGSISSETFKTTKSFDLAGVNILNRKPLDARTALDKLQRRRETHNRVERKRRDCINQLIDDLTKLLPPEHLEEASSKCHRVNVLRGAVAHIKFLTESNIGLERTLNAAKSEGFNIPEDLGVSSATASSSSDKENADKTETADKAMSMDVDMEEEGADANSVKQEDADNDHEVQMKEVNTPSRTSSPVAASASASASPRLTPSKVLGQPQLIVTNASSPKTERPSISISTAPADPYSLESHPPAASSISESTTPVSPAFPASPKSNPSTASSSPSTRQESFQAKDNSKQQLQQQLSPFLQTITLSTSLSLPPISSLANLKIQSPSGQIDGPSPAERQFEERPSSPTLRSATTPSNTNNNGNNKNGSHQRTGPTLPPLKIPAPQHLHPSYKQGAYHSTHDSRANSRSGPTLSPHQHATSPHHQRAEGDQHQQQPPVSPFMLSPLMSRSPSMGPLSASSAGTSPYPHWGHEGAEGQPPHQGQYMPPHGYPHGYPYPYPYHPSYGYPHPPHGHPPPPHHHPHPHHHQHAPPSPHSPQQRPASPYPPAAATRPMQPEPIFIQEEPWNVQRKRSTSNGAGKTQPGKQQANGGGNKKVKEGSVIREEETPVSPSSSVASNTSSYNHRKRPSSSSHKGGNGYDESEETFKRVRQHEESSRQGKDVDLSKNDQDNQQGVSVNNEDDSSPTRQQRDSGIVVVVVKADDDHAKASRDNDAEMTGNHHQDAAQALTSLSAA